MIEGGQKQPVIDLIIIVTRSFGGALMMVLSPFLGVNRVAGGKENFGG